MGVKTLVDERGYKLRTIVVHEDNQAAQHKGKRRVKSQRSKHIDIVTGLLC